MSSVLTTAVAAVLLLSASTADPVSPAVALTAAPQYDACATTQLVKTAPRPRARHKPKHSVRAVAAPVVKPHPLLKKPLKKHWAHKRAAHIARARETCAGPAGGPGELDFTPLLTMASLAGPTISAPSTDDLAASDAAATPDMPAASQLPLSDDSPFAFGLGDGPGGSLIGGGGGGGGGGGQGAPGGGDVTPTQPITPQEPITPSGPITPTGPSAPVPEPSTWAVMLFGFGMLGAALRRRAAYARLSN